MELTKNALSVLESRYLGKGESPSSLFKRVAGFVANGDTELEKQFYDMMSELSFLPNTPTLINSARYSKQLSACFTLPIRDNIPGIFEAIRNAALIHVSGGGTGFDFSDLRPKGSSVSNSSGESSGPVSFMRIFDVATQELKQGGIRKGANIGTLRIDHPDIYEFVSMKNEEGFLSNFNISVAVTDDFMTKLENREDSFDLVFGGEVYKTVDPKDLWDKIVDSCWLNGEPGILFIDRINEKNKLKELENIKAVNPCLTGDSSVLTEYGIRKVKDTEIGDIIWSESGWTKVTNFQMSGIKKTYRYRTNAGVFEGTPNHKIVQNGEKTEVKYAIGIDKLRGYYNPNPGCTSIDLQDVMDGVMLGNGVIREDCTPTNNEYSQEIVSLFVGEKSFDYFESELKDFISYKSIDGVYHKVKTTITTEELLNISDRKIPLRFKYNPLKARGILRGLYMVNGYVLEDKKCIGIKSQSQQMADDIQLLLSSIGISSYRTINKGSLVCNKNEVYLSRDSYEINIGRDCYLFDALIGFTQDSKIRSLNKVCSTPPTPYETKIPYSINESMYLGRQKVYDITVDNLTHTFWNNGLNVSNCGEQPLPPYGSCILGSINLGNFVNDDGETEFEKLKNIIELGVTFLDNTIDVTSFPLPEIREEALSKRRIGLGIMGFADYLIKKKICYGSIKCLMEIDSLMSFFREVAYEKSKTLGEQKGVPPLLLEHGIKRRNGVITTIAPTGSLSLIAGCSSGCEPIFSFNYEKSCIDTTLNISSDNLDLETKEDYMLSALEISPEDHLSVLSTFQKYIDAGISKTINLPNSTSKETVSDLLKDSYTSWCKSVTVYRTGSRKFEALKDKTVTKTPEISSVNSQSLRPKILEGFTQKVQTGVGTLYVTINEQNEKPFEIFLKVGKSGGENSAYSEAIGRLASLSLRSGIPIFGIIKTLKDISGSEFVWDEGVLIKSVPDALSKVLENRYISHSPAHEEKLSELFICPDCSCSDLVTEEGCIKCRKCGWSKCS